MNWYAPPASYLASLVENQSWSAKSTKLTAFLRSLRWIFEEVALENSIIQVQCGLKRLGRHLIEDGTSSRDAESPSNMKILKYLPHRLSSFCNIPPSNHHLVFQRTRCKSIFCLILITLDAGQNAIQDERGSSQILFHLYLIRWGLVKSSPNKTK